MTSEHSGTHSACHTPGGSSRGSAQKCPRSCCWCDRRSVPAAECPAHTTQNNESIQTKATSRPLRNRLLSNTERKGDHKGTLPVRLCSSQTPHRGAEASEVEKQRLHLRQVGDALLKARKLDCDECGSLFFVKGLVKITVCRYQKSMMASQKAEKWKLKI